MSSRTPQRKAHTLCHGIIARAIRFVIQFFATSRDTTPAVATAPAGTLAGEIAATGAEGEIAATGAEEEEEGEMIVAGAAGDETDAPRDALLMVVTAQYPRQAFPSREK